MSKRSQRIVLGTLAFIVLLTIYMYAVLFTSFGLSAKENVFAKRILEAQDKIFVADIYPEPWDFVCLVPPYATASGVIADYKKTAKDTLRFADIPDLSATEEVWGIVFVSAANEVHTLHMKPDFYHKSGRCADRDRAHLSLADDRKGISLIAAKKE